MLPSLVVPKQPDHRIVIDCVLLVAWLLYQTGSRERFWRPTFVKSLLKEYMSSAGRHSWLQLNSGVQRDRKVARRNAQHHGISSPVV